MLAKSALTALALTAALIGQSALAQDTQVPAETPPASYEGLQYVDSRGCIYVRTGYGDAITWIPRVTRSGQHLCGAEPTFAGARQPRN